MNININFSIKHRRNNQKGFTMLELLMVILVVGILASLGIPHYEAFVEGSRKAEAIAHSSAISKAIFLSQQEDPALGIVLANTGRTFLVDMEMPVAPNPNVLWDYEIYSMNGMLGIGDCQIAAWRTGKDNGGGMVVICWLFDVLNGEITGSQGFDGGQGIYKLGTCVGTTL